MSNVSNADAMAVDCPACGTRAGTPCFEVPGMDAFHHSRWWEAEKAAEDADDYRPGGSAVSKLAEDDVVDVPLPGGAL